MRNSNILYAISLIISDAVAIIAAFVFAFIVRVKVSDQYVEPVTASEYIRIIALMLPIWLIIFAFLGLYRKETYSKLSEEIPRLLVGSMIGVLTITTYDFVTEDPLLPARVRIPIYAFLFVFTILVLLRSVLRYMRRFMYRYGVGVERVLVIGDSVHTQKLIEQLQDTRKSGYAIIGVIGKNYKGPLLKYSSLDQAKKYMDKHGITMLVQTELFPDEQKNLDIFSTAQVNHISYKFIPTSSYFYGFKNSVEVTAGFPTVNVHQTALIGWGRVVKRLFDIVASIIALIIFGPIMLVFALVVKATDHKGPILYKAPRVSRYGRTKKIYKFRSMFAEYSGMSQEKSLRKIGRDDLADQLSEHDAQITDDPRVTHIGRFMRRTSIDELPQLINVIKGDISLVGPRAVERVDLARYKKSGDLMLSVRTGITGLAQVNGRSELSYEERARLNMLYVQKWSFWLDIKILLRTGMVVFKSSTHE